MIILKPCFSSQVGKQLVEKLIQAQDSFTLASDHQEVRPRVHAGEKLLNLALLWAVLSLDQLAQDSFPSDI